MCGIAGLVHSDGGRADGATARQMIARLRHRGPDAGGTFAEGPAALAHARLSVIDLAGGRQPMFNEDRSLVLVFNGEIFNYLELRTELAELGHRFQTQSDTEVILHAYEQYGPACVERFNGQWAFALWDRRRRRLFASRDRFGIRPFYYAQTHGKFVFASEMKALFADGDVPRAVDFRGLAQVLTFWTTIAPTTIFSGVRELPPAHNLVLEDGRATVSRYWDLDFGQIEPIESETAAEQLRELLADATRLRLRADVPVASYLSGGLDSTLTTALAQSAGALPTAYCVAFDDPEFDERGHQQAAAEGLDVERREVLCSLDDIAQALPQVVWHAERPLVRTAPAPLYLLAEQVRDDGVKVVVTGEGADEMLGGYDLFKEAKIRRFWARQPGSSPRAELLSKLYPYLPGFQAQPLEYRKAFFHVRPEDMGSPLFSHLPRWDLTARLQRLLAPEIRAELAGYNAYSDCIALLPTDYARWHPFCQAQYIEAAILLPGYVLGSQGDRMAMARGVEARFPFLDYRVAEFAARLPPRLKMRGLDEKHILKRAARGLVPECVRQRTKQPYRAPEAGRLLAGDARPDRLVDLVSPGRLRASGLFDPSSVAALVEKARQGRAIGMKDQMGLAAILTMQLLVEQFIEGNGNDPRSGGAIPALAAGGPIERSELEPSAGGTTWR